MIATPECAVLRRRNGRDPPSSSASLREPLLIEAIANTARLRIPSPIRAAQGAAVVVGGVEPFRRLFHSLYGLGLRTVVARLARLDTVHSIYGCGSFFSGNCLYGHSDIDLIIVLKPSVARDEGHHGEVGRVYERVRRFFPFLGRWGEKAANLVFLHEVESGFPVLESFRVRMKQGRLVRLYGAAFPIGFDHDRPTASEIASERGTLARTAILTAGPPARTALFWKRLFVKLQALADDAGLEAVGNAISAEARRRFGTLSDRRLFFRRVDPMEYGGIFLRHAAACAERSGRDASQVTVRFERSGAPSTRDDPALGRRLNDVLGAAGFDERGLRMLPTVPIGLTPELFYFPIDGPMPFVEIPGDAYAGLRRLLVAMRRRGRSGDALLVRAGGMLAIVERQLTYADIVPLDPQVHANVYAWIAGDVECTMARCVYDEQVALSRQRCRALASMYQRHEDWVPKGSTPGVYREDDLDTLHNAFSSLRALATVSDAPTYFATVADLIESYRRRHPEASSFLGVLLEDFRYHRGEVPRRPVAPNLYRCLHQFMRQALTEAEAIVVDDTGRGLTITVGIITRNRAADLRDALRSLEALTRPPEEVVVVDNGSTDDTRTVVESFADRLPIRYVMVPEPSIPLARNAVLAHARSEVVAFTDDDCAVDPDWLVAVERGFMRARNVGIVGGWVLHWPAAERSTVDTYFGLFHHNKP